MVRAEDCIERAVKPFDEVCSEIGATLKWQALEAKRRRAMAVDGDP